MDSKLDENKELLEPLVKTLAKEQARFEEQPSTSSGADLSSEEFPIENFRNLRDFYDTHVGYLRGRKEELEAEKRKCITQLKLFKSQWDLEQSRATDLVFEYLEEMTGSEESAREKYTSRLDELLTLAQKYAGLLGVRVPKDPYKQLDLIERCVRLMSLRRLRMKL